jgi:transposase-like protein
MIKWADRYPEIAEHLDTNWQCYLDAFETAKDMREAGFDLEFMQNMIDTMAAAINGRGVYPSDDFFFQSMFDIMVSYFPGYKTEIVIE